MGAAGPPGGSPNPLKQVLDAVGEKVDCITYDRVSPCKPLLWPFSPQRLTPP